MSEEMKETIEIIELKGTAEAEETVETIDFKETTETEETIDIHKTIESNNTKEKKNNVETKAKKEKNKMTQTRLGKKLTRIMIISMVIVSAMFLVGGGIIFFGETGKFYKSKVFDVSNTIAESVDTRFIKKLIDMVETDEYREVYEQASYENQAPIISYLKKKGIYEEYTNLVNQLGSFSESMNVEYLYIQNIHGDTATYIIEPTGGYYSLGNISEVPLEYNGVVTNEHIEPKVSYDKEFGWLSSGGEPLYDEAGNAIAVICVDINMSEIVKRLVNYLVIMLIVLFMSVIFVYYIYANLLNFYVVNPIKRLTDYLVRFGNSENGYDKDSIDEVEITSGDEIEEMYHKFRYMQEQIIDYMDNLENMTAERERIGAEMEIATSIQKGILEDMSSDLVSRPEYDLYASMTPAREVGGDFYDFFMLDSDHIAILVADVSDKGVGAAFFMAIAKTLIKSYAKSTSSPAEVLSKVDKQISEKNGVGMFVTVWLAIIDLNTGHVTYCNAGHDYPLIKQDSKGYELVKSPHGPPVSFIPGMDFPENEFTMKKGDSIFLYTDGLNEAKRGDGERFGIDRMIEVLNEHQDDDNANIIWYMREAVDKFVGDEPQFDDMTMFGFTFKGRE